MTGNAGPGPLRAGPRRSALLFVSLPLIGTRMLEGRPGYAARMAAVNALLTVPRRRRA